MLPASSISATKAISASAYQASPPHKNFSNIWKRCYHQTGSHCTATTHRSSGNIFSTALVHSTHTRHSLPYLAAISQQPIRSQLSESLSAGVCAMEEASSSIDRAAACRAYVGEATPAAAEYHCNDFDWEDLKQEAEAVLAERHAQLQEHAQASVPSQQSMQPASGVTKTVESLFLQQQQQQEVNSSWQYEKGCWEAFHARDNATARFYKERRYLLLEFPCLTIGQPPQHFLEIGCGCGSSLLPVLKANPTCTVTGTDLSPTAVHMFKQAAAKAGIAADRVTAFAVDSTLSDAEAASAAITGPQQADAVLLIFTLAAVAPQEMAAMLRTAFQALRPGGLLLIRDHGLYDLTHLRLPPEQQLADKLYRRLDGTTCYFFTSEDLRARAEAAGFVTEECKYACTSLLNRKKQIHMKRVFVHGVFQKVAKAVKHRSPP